MKNIFYIRYMIKHEGIRTMLSLAIQLMIALVPLAQTLSISILVSNITKYVEGTTEIETCMVSVLVFVLVILAERVLLILRMTIDVKRSLNVSFNYKREVISRCAGLKYSVLEDCASNELIERVSRRSGERMEEGFSNIIGIASVLVKLVSLMILVSSINSICGVIMSVFFAGMIFLANKCGEESYRAFADASKCYRRARSFRLMIVNRELAAERTLYNYSTHINHRWDKCYSDGLSIDVEITKSNIAKMHAYASLVSIVLFGLLAILVIPLKTGEMSGAMYVSLTISMLQLLNLLMWNTNVYLEAYAKAGEYVDDYEQFCKLEQKDICVDSQNLIREIETIEFDNITFTYPGTQEPIIKNFSLILESGNTYGLVGENGCGKTTLIKLLTGLYDNYEGCIKVNGSDIRNLSTEQKCEVFGVLYQDFTQYHFSVRENLLLGNDKDVNDNELLEALEMVGLKDKFEACEIGLDTELGKLADQELDLSGGEWQRLSIARMLLRNNQVLIMDEPTAAIDPISEKKIYNLLEKNSKSRMSIMITHRLGATKSADHICVIDNGRLCEMGTHEELMSKEGKYAEMFYAQKEWYEEDEKTK